MTEIDLVDAIQRLAHAVGVLCHPPEGIIVNGKLGCWYEKDVMTKIVRDLDAVTHELVAAIPPRPVIVLEAPPPASSAAPVHA